MTLNYFTGPLEWKVETLSKPWKTAGVRLAEGAPGESAVLGCLWCWGLKRSPGLRGTAASTGFLSRTAGPVWKTVSGKSRVGSKSYSQPFKPFRQLPYKGKNC